MTKLARRFLTPGAALAFSACAASVSPVVELPSGTGPVDAPASRESAAAATIRPSDMYARIAFLSSDLLQGRDTPSRGLEIAADYLVHQYRLLGLEPAGEAGGFHQWYPFPLRQVDVGASSVSVTTPRGAIDFVVSRDFFVSGGTRTPVSAPLVFVGAEGAGALAEESLRQRVAMVSLPGSFSRDWRIERNRLLGAVRAAGATAAVFVLDGVWTPDSIARYGAMMARPQRVLGGDVAFPQIFLSRAAASRIAAGAGLEPEALWSASAARTMLPGVTLTAGIPQRELDRARAPNVVAVLRGSDPVLRDEYVVLSAHMDHVGIGRPVNGDSIYNGADDDASGTAALVEVAEAIAGMPTAPRRSIVFLHVSGEEKGLLGSRWFSDHPTLPLERMVANVNVDMIGRNAPDTVVVIGKDYSSLGRVVNSVRLRHPELGLTAADDLWPEERFFFRSDHFNFARKEIPSIFFFSGVHEDYHRPSDEVDRIDADKSARVARYIFHTVLEIANADARPRWDARGLEEVRALTR